VLGIATNSHKDALIVSRVIVRLRTDGSIQVEPLTAWQGTPRDEARSMNDLVDALANTLDPKRRGAPVAIALKRTESTRGRPTKQYDQKVRAEGAAMVAASTQGRRYFKYRTTQLGKDRALTAEAAAHKAYPRRRRSKTQSRQPARRSRNYWMSARLTTESWGVPPRAAAHAVAQARGSPSPSNSSALIHTQGSPRRAGARGSMREA
jgi:hypothetical protein